MLSRGISAAPLTSFVGRTAAIEEVALLIERHRLVTLTGPGGCGKTRLAIEVATRLEPSFTGGAAFVDLAPIDAGSIVPSAVAAATGVPESGGDPIEERLAAALADRRLLLVVDNCEHVVDACAALLHVLLSRCPSLVVLATSRVPVGVAGEATWRVPSLAVPAESRNPAAALNESEAGQLLLERARLADPELVFSDDEAAAAVGICRRLDGLPLAIELAAGRLRVLDIKSLVDGLDRRVELLAGGPRTAPPRQQTLEASIEWSYDLLGPSDRALFRRISVFAGSFSVEATEVVCVDAEVTAPDIRTILAELVDASLLHIDGQSYRLLETIRQFALARLSANDEEISVRERHLDYLLEVTSSFDRVAEGQDVAVACDRVEPLLDDIRSAIDWTLRTGRTVAGLTLAADLRLFWILRNRHREGVAHLNALLDADNGDDARARARALVAAVQLGLYDVDPSGWVDRAAEAIEAARDLGDTWLEGRALMLAGWVHQYIDPPAAKELLIDAREMTEACGDRRGFQNASYGLGGVAAATGDLALARDALERGIAAADPNATAGVRVGLTVLGYVHLLQGHLTVAEATLLDALSRMPPGMDRHNRDEALTYLALALAYQGRYDEARTRFDEAIASLREIGNPYGNPLLHYGLLEYGLGNNEAALARLGEAQTMLERLGLPWLEIQARVCLGESMAAIGKHSIARRSWRNAADRAEATHNPLAQAVASMGLARAAALDGDSDQAGALLRRALRSAVGSGYHLGAIDALEALALTSHAGAGALLGAVDAERKRIGYVRFPVGQAAVDAAGVEVDRDQPTLTFDDAIALALDDDAPVGRPASGWDSLTAAEERVARLVVEGLTNPEIGERLFISRRTVQAHLAKVFAKLGVSSRAELAAFISRRE